MHGQTERNYELEFRQSDLFRSQGEEFADTYLSNDITPRMRAMLRATVESKNKPSLLRRLFSW
jgi:hypothetical protein